MRSFLAAMLAALFPFTLLSTVPAAAQPLPEATVYTVAGKIGETYLKYGGEAKLGAAESPETKIVVAGRNTYHQHFENGFVFWSSYQGGKVSFAPKSIDVAGVGADRDALAPYGMTGEIYFRSANLCKATTAGKQIMNALLHGGTIIDLRTSGAISSCKDPVLTGVNRVNIPVPSHANYVKYSTGGTERGAFKAALTAIANSRGDVWVHCSAGKDRTGWTTMLTMVIASKDEDIIPWGDIYKEFLKTSQADEGDLVAGLDAIAKKFGYPNYPVDDGANGVLNFIRDQKTGMGVPESTLDKIAARYGKA